MDVNKIFIVQQLFQNDIYLFLELKVKVTKTLSSLRFGV